MVPFLLFALAVALFFEFGLVETFNPNEEKGELIASAPLDSVETLRTKSSLQKVVLRGEGRLSVGEGYDSLDALMVDLDFAGFVHQNGTRHNYQRFDGYDMKVVRLRTGDNEV